MKKKVKKPARKQDQESTPKPGEYWACVNGAIVKISDALGKPNVHTIVGRVVTDFSRVESGLGLNGGIPMAWDSETMNFKYSGGLKATGDMVHQYKLHHLVNESKIKVVAEPAPEPEHKIQLTLGSDWKCRNGNRVSIVHVGRTYAIGIVRDGVGGVLESGFGLNYYMDGKSDSIPRDLEITGPWVDPVPWDWSTTPPWLNGIVQGPSGKWYLFESDAKIVADGLVFTGSSSVPIPLEHYPKWSGDWRQSITVRPGYKEEK